MESSKERLAADTALVTATVAELEVQTPVSFHHLGYSRATPGDSMTLLMSCVSFMEIM